MFLFRNETKAVDQTPPCVPLMVPSIICLWQAASVAARREAAAPVSPATCGLASAHVLARAVKLEHAGRNPPPLRWAGAEQPAVWTDVLAEMSRHIYIRNKIGEGIPAPIFQVGVGMSGTRADIRWSQIDPVELKKSSTIFEVHLKKLYWSKKRNQVWK